MVKNYNKSPHRSLNYLAPKDVNKANEADVWAHMYLKKRKPKLNKQGKRSSYKPKIKFKKGQFVRISFVKRPLTNFYMDQYSTKVFKVIRSFLKQGIPMYKLEDLKSREIQGSFYNSELIAVNKSEDSLWYISEILKKRKHQGRLQYFVSWEGFPKDFNSWVDSDWITGRADATK